jgi:sporulation protein, ylmC/ymxH family
LNKQVVNIRCGDNIGCVADILVDTSTGCVSKLLVPKKNSFLSCFTKREYYFINWCDIVKVGEDLILVDTNIFIKKED